jgi:hypothetical protein
MTFAEFKATEDLSKWKAIIKPMADGRRLLVGFERRNRRSRKYAEKQLLNPPPVLEELVAGYKSQLNATDPQPVPTPASPA